MKNSFLLHTHKSIFSTCLHLRKNLTFIEKAVDRNFAKDLYRFWKSDVFQFTLPDKVSYPMKPFGKKYLKFGVPKQRL